jgi:hypothetical protein
LDELEPFAWTFPYIREAAGRADPAAFILRPAVNVRFAGHDGVAESYEALVDSGAENVLAADWLAMHHGITPSGRRQTIRIGGAARNVVFEDVELELLSPDGTGSICWRTEVGFMDWSDPPWLIILGQRGFWDRYSVCMSRLSQSITVHHRDHYDQTYNTGLV